MIASFAGSEFLCVEGLAADFAFDLGFQLPNYQITQLPNPPSPREQLKF